jgi:NAD(P)H-flavin reductase/ferredoxin
MPRVTCDGRAVAVRPGQRLLDALLEAGLTVPHSCRAGACQSCLVKATGGTPPAAAQAGLKDSLRAQGYFLSCAAELREDLEITLDGARELSVPARIAEVDALSRDVVRVMVTPSALLPHRAGQFVTLVRPDGLARAYSIASLPHAASTALELHVRVHPKGRMSRWLASPEAPGAAVAVRGPAGACFYTPSDPTQPLLLAGTGTGLAPLWGIARDALSAGHTGPIELWHGARVPGGFYLVDEIMALCRQHAQVTFRRCVLDGPSGPGIETGRLDEVLLARGPFAGRRIFLCGDPELVQGLKRRMFLAGAALRDIHADPFLTAAPG